MQIETKNAIYTFFPGLSILVNSELEDEFKHLLPAKVDEEKLIDKTRIELSDDDLEELIGSLRMITFNVTEECSYRCSYCIFSGNYEKVRTHSQKKMSFNTARKMIDYLVEWISHKKRNLKYNSINIGFYGGEPLLEIHLIEKIMAYTQKRFREKDLREKFEVRFSMTTNGYLLEGNIIELLVKNNVTLDISLDGPREEHDKFRVTRGGKGTWETIMKNLETIRLKYPEYYENNIKFLCNLHPLHDFARIDDFFNDAGNHIDVETVITNTVTMDELKESIKTKILANMKKQESLLLLKNMSSRLDSRLKYKEISDNTKFTATCMPNEWKLFIDTEGRFHFCEKVKTGFPIGDVENGFDFEKIRQFYRSWSEFIIKTRCWECSVWSFCNVCPAHNKKEKEIEIDCSSRRNDIAVLKEYLTFKEEQDKKIRKSKKIGNIKDYIRQLETFT